EYTRGVVERHLLTAGGGVSRPVFPIQPGATDRVVVAPLPRTPTPRFDASTFGFGSFTSKVFPSTVWSAAPARDARTAVTVRATAKAERRMCMTSPGDEVARKKCPRRRWHAGAGDATVFTDSSRPSSSRRCCTEIGRAHV